MTTYPWFKVMASDVLADEDFASWSLEERGAYFTLLCMAWQAGSIPASHTALARLVRVDGADMARTLSAVGRKFIEHPTDKDRLVSPMLEAQLDVIKALSDKRSKVGTIGAKARWQTHKFAMANGWQTDAIKSKSKEEEETTETNGRSLLPLAEGSRGRAKAPSKADPRHQATIAAWLSTFKTLLGREYTMVNPGKDGAAGKRLLKSTPDTDVAEIERRMRIALTDPWFQRSGDLAMFCSKWNAFASLVGGVSVNATAPRMMRLAGEPPGEG
jgi:uncharacterized protein YdaU (DUF1376 family)